MVADISAEIVSIGTEILLGEITDTNSVFLARTLRDLGVDVYYLLSVGDNRQRIAEVVLTALSRSDVVITCGGLGPTVDDMTREAIAAATGRELVFSQSLLDMIAARFANFRVPMTDNNRRQAYIPAGAVPIENPVGTAPAFMVEINDKVVVSLPGVPREMKYLMLERVVPYLRERYGMTEQIILARVLKTAGIGESMLDEMLGVDLLESSNPSIGLAAHSGQIDIRITAKANTKSDAAVMIAPMETAVRERAGDYVFGADADSLEDVLAQLLKAQGGSIAVSETGIGQVVYERLVTPFNNAGLELHVESYPHPDALRAALQVDASVDLRALARSAAEALLQRTQGAVSIAVVSQPDVAEGDDENVSTAVAVCTAQDCRQRVYGFGGRSENARQFVGNWSTAVAWRMTKELDQAR